MTTLLGYEIGVLSRITGVSYAVVACHAPDANHEPGTTFVPGDTYCSLMRETGELLSFEHIEQSAYRRHTCSSAFELESDAGVPVYREDEVWGTLNVSSSVPRSSPLPEPDGDPLRVLASWVGGELAKQDLRGWHR